MWESGQKLRQVIKRELGITSWRSGFTSYCTSSTEFVPKMITFLDSVFRTIRYFGIHVVFVVPSEDEPLKGSFSPPTWFITLWHAESFCWRSLQTALCWKKDDVQHLKLEKVRFISSLQDVANYSASCIDGQALNSGLEVTVLIDHSDLWPLSAII